MSALFGWSTTQFDKLLEKATSHLLLEPDWDSILQICDCIRQGDVQPKYVVSCVKKKLYAQNPHVVLYTLQVLESVVKNCGSPIHVEVASRPFMEELREVVKNTTNDNVKNRILELVQAWAYAFRNQPKYRAVQDVFNLLRMEGYKLQVLKESDAMFLADTAPDWADGDCCHRCRVQFSVVQRKHHCRNCGQIFCSKCSARTAPIPNFGIEKEVRVCEACWENLNKPSGAKPTASGESSPKLGAKQAPTAAPPGGKTEQELKEEEDLQLALALSQSEAESKGSSSKERPQVAKQQPSLHSSIALDNEVVVEPAPKKGILVSSDSELDRYLNRSYWEQRNQQQQKDNEATVVLSSDIRTSPIPSAPISSLATYNTVKVNEKYQNGDVDGMTDFLNNLKSSLEIFVNRMKSNSTRGRPISNDTYVQSQFMNITNMHSQLLKYIQEQEDSRSHFEGLQDKLNQIRDARAALDALREEHREKLQREAEEAERQRQIQMAHKLQIMREKKQEYLQYQRQLAIQRMQEQEREMLLRHEQQKHQYHQQQQVIHQPGPVPQNIGYPQQQPATQQYMPPGSQPYIAMPNAGPIVAQQNLPPNYPPNYRQAMNVAPPQIPVNNYRQPFNMQVMSGALPVMPPGTPYQQIPQNSAPVNNQNPMMVMHPGMMAQMPSHMMRAPSMPQQNIPVTNVPNSMPTMVNQPGVGVHSMGAIPHGPEHSVPHIPIEKKEAEPLITFD